MLEFLSIFSLKTTPNFDDYVLITTFLTLADDFFVISEWFLLPFFFHVIDFLFLFVYSRWWSHNFYFCARCTFTLLHTLRSIVLEDGDKFLNLSSLHLLRFLPFFSTIRYSNVRMKNFASLSLQFLNALILTTNLRSLFHS